MLMHARETRIRAYSAYLARFAFAAVFVLNLLFTGCGKKAAVKPPSPASPRPASSRGSPTTIPSPKPDASQPGTGPAADTTIFSLSSAGPSIRIGLTTGSRDIRISAPGEFFLVERRPEASRRSVGGEILVRVEGGEPAGDTFRVQVASLSRREAAEALRSELAGQFSQPVLVRENTASSTFQVRIGEFASREGARRFAQESLASAGYGDFVVIREVVEGSGSATRQLAARGPASVFLISPSGFLFAPRNAGEFLRFNGKPYRGILEVSLNRNGLITVVNQLGVDEYLLGVVPAEMSPSRYPEYAALAAQSIAARTYALKNMGRFRADGFDLTDDTRTQVYGGVLQEKAPTNEAVRGTAGLALYYRGGLIDAMYTSTCGGRTEDFAAVYDAQDVPYLRSVACTLEQELPDQGTLTVAATMDSRFAALTSDGRPASRNLALSGVLGLAPPASLNEGEAGAAPTAAELRRWVDKAASIIGEKHTSGLPNDAEILSRAGFIRFAAGRLFGEDEITRRITTADIDYYLGTLADQDDIPSTARGAVAFLMRAGLWSPFPDNTARPRSPVTRTDALYLLVRWLEYARPGILRTGTFAGPATRGAADSNPNPGLIAVQWGNRSGRFRLSPDLRLFRMADGRSTPVENLRLIGSEKLRFHLGPDDSIDFLEIELSQSGAANDRFSPVATWQTTIKRADLAEKLRGFPDAAGEIVDVRPARTGESGRVVRIELVGTRSSTVMNGYKFRNALGLRDTLFTITREVDPDGRIESFTFRGRGWGHGVGLCQVGAYGMARAGRTPEAILKTYYRDVEIRKAY